MHYARLTIINKLRDVIQWQSDMLNRSLSASRFVLPVTSPLSSALTPVKIPMFQSWIFRNVQCWYWGYGMMEFGIWLEVGPGKWSLFSQDLDQESLYSGSPTMDYIRAWLTHDMYDVAGLPQG